jgi:hypothetical protein
MSLNSTNLLIRI